ncbi:MAG: ceramidase domain-containing protein, partial [Planctomycetes bacterium]|nr:ceramidase domain-containing protein [Planctomycetota bacterium]
LADGGPRYVETPPDPYAPGAPVVAEPWNTVTASLFIWIALAWLWRVRGRYRDFPFLTCCMPILLAGGIGGTLFHGTRTRYVYFLLDVVPISVLGLAGAVFMAYRYFGKQRIWVPFGLLVFYAAVNRLFFSALGPVNRQLSINLSYASLAAIVLTPVALVLWRSRFRHGGWVVVGLLSFGIAWFFRLVDPYSAEYLTTGTHWLWHTFGAISTAAMIQYFYKIEGETAEPKPPEAGLPPIDEAW